MAGLKINLIKKKLLALILVQFVTFSVKTTDLLPPVHNLLYMDFGGVEAVDYATATCFAINTGSTLRPYNRAYNKVTTTDHDVKKIISYFGETPFSWPVDESDQETIKLLEDNLLSCKVTFPAMVLDLTTVEQPNYKNNIVIQEIIDDQDIATWLSIISQTYNYPKIELAKAVKNLIQRASGAIKFYVGFYENKPVAACMAIQHQDTVSMHMIGTLTEYRNKGIGYAITHKALSDAKLQGHTYALLLATEMARPLYEKLGFKEYARYKMYCNYTIDK